MPGRVATLATCSSAWSSRSVADQPVVGEDEPVDAHARRSSRGIRQRTSSTRSSRIGAPGAAAPAMGARIGRRRPRGSMARRRADACATSDVQVRRQAPAAAGRRLDGEAVVRRRLHVRRAADRRPSNATSQAIRASSARRRHVRPADRLDRRAPRAPRDVDQADELVEPGEGEADEVGRARARPGARGGTPRDRARRIASRSMSAVRPASASPASSNALARSGPHASSPASAVCGSRR